MGGGGGGTVQSFPGSAIAANTAFQQWNDYQQRFLPVQNQLINTINSPDMLNQDREMAYNTADQAVQSAIGAQNRSLGRLGAVPNGDQQSSINQSQSLAQTAQQVAGQNQAELHTQASNLALMGGGLSSLAGAMTGPGSA